MKGQCILWMKTLFLLQLIPGTWILIYHIIANNVCVLINAGMNLGEDLFKWVDPRIAKKRFEHRIHTVEFALQKLKEESE